MTVKQTLKTVNQYPPDNFKQVFGARLKFMVLLLTGVVMVYAFMLLVISVSIQNPQ